MEGASIFILQILALQNNNYQASLASHTCTVGMLCSF